jgi:ADP-ribose pyrophosphatase YjhB (NUDIX family)
MIHCQRCDGRIRPVCETCGAVTYLDPKLAVAIVIERDGLILLGKRGIGTRAPGLWSFPAGFVERGEVVEAAAAREVREETGLTVMVGPVLRAFSEPGEAVVLLAYPATSVTGDPLPGDDLDELAWFATDALPALAFGHDLEIVRLWQDWRGSRLNSLA